MELEDELGDILEKARNGKRWSQADLAKSTGINSIDIIRIENYDWTPEEKDIFRIASVLNLHGPSLAAIAAGKWVPKKETSEKDSELLLESLKSFYLTPRNSLTSSFSGRKKISADFWKARI